MTQLLDLTLREAAAADSLVVDSGSGPARVVMSDARFGSHVAGLYFSGEATLGQVLTSTPAQLTGWDAAYSLPANVSIAADLANDRLVVGRDGLYEVELSLSLRLADQGALTCYLAALPPFNTDFPGTWRVYRCYDEIERIPVHIRLFAELTTGTHLYPRFAHTDSAIQEISGALIARRIA